MAYNQFDGISKSRIQQSTQCLTEWHGKFLSGEGEQRGERDDGDEIQDEFEDRVPVENSGNDTQRDKDE